MSVRVTAPFLCAWWCISQLQQQVSSLYASGEYEAALAAAETCLGAVEDAFGKKHTVYASSLNNVGACLKVRDAQRNAGCAYPLAHLRRM